MRTLIAIVSCARDTALGLNQAARETWIPTLEDYDYKIFIGIGQLPARLHPRFLAGRKRRSRTHPEELEGLVALDHSLLRGDEVLLDASDTYHGLSYKAKELYRWAVAHDYNRVFLLDVDTYLEIERLTSSDHAAHDFWGWKVNAPAGPWAIGGFGSSLSRKACEIVSGAEVDRCAHKDVWVSRALQQHGINLARCRSLRPTFNAGHRHHDFDGRRAFLYRIHSAVLRRQRRQGEKDNANQSSADGPATSRGGGHEECGAASSGIFVGSHQSSGCVSEFTR
jgi:hypothetical protein